jgi:hypothetical protein
LCRERNVAIAVDLKGCIHDRVRTGRERLAHVAVHVEDQSAIGA